MKSIGIVVPCYNEEPTIRKFYQATEAVFRGMPYRHEYMFVDDGSTDKTLMILRNLHRRDPEHVHYLSFSRNFGEEAGMVAGFTHLHTDYTAKMDADLQDPPKLLPQMAYYLNRGYDCVGCIQVGRHQGKLRAWLSKEFYHFINHVSSVCIQPNVRDFRLMDGRFLNSFLKLSERNRFAKGLMSWVGYPVKFLKFKSRPRSAGTSDWSMLSLMKYALEAIIDFSDAPLDIVLFIGGLLCATATLTGIVCLLVNACSAWWLACLLTMLTGIQAVCTGVVGRYARNTYFETKHRPLYLIKEQR